MEGVQKGQKGNQSRLFDKASLPPIYSISSIRLLGVPIFIMKRQATLLAILVPT